MALISNIVLADGVPANHTFSPVEIDAQRIATFREAGTTLIGRPEITLQLRANGANSVNRVKGVIRLPVLATPVAGVNPAVAYTLTGSFDLSLPLFSTVAERKNIRVLVANLLANALVIDMSDNGNGLTGV